MCGLDHSGCPLSELGSRVKRQPVMAMVVCQYDFAGDSVQQPIFTNHPLSRLMYFAINLLFEQGTLALWLQKLPPVCNKQGCRTVIKQLA
ncbi:hypothetical protein WJX82_001336 [Trebouxia sp. C0006]